MKTLLRSLAVLAVAIACAAGAAEAPAAQVHSACKHVRIHGHRVCLAPGKFCTRQWESAYRHHGYTCSFLDQNDRYRLRRFRR